MMTTEIEQRRSTLKRRLYISGIDANGFDLAKENGLGFEIAAFCWAPQMENAETLRIARQQSCSGMSLWFHAPFAEMIPCSIDPEIRRTVSARLHQALKLSLGLGISRIVIHGGFIPTVYYPQWYIDQSVLFWKGFLRELDEVYQNNDICGGKQSGDAAQGKSRQGGSARREDSCGLRIALENVMEPSPDLLVRIVEGVADPHLGLCLDVGHANSCVSSVPVTHWAEAFAPHLFHVHLHNNDGDRDFHAPLGKGTIPMEAVLDRLLLTDATFTIENQDCRPSLAWLQKKGYL